MPSNFAFEADAVRRRAVSYSGRAPRGSMRRSAAEGFRVGEPGPEAHIVYCRSQTLLDRRQYGSWRDVQDAYDDYMTSLGPWSEAEIAGFFEDDRGADDSRWPFTRRAIADFFRSGELLLVCPEPEPGAAADPAS